MLDNTAPSRLQVAYNISSYLFVIRFIFSVLNLKIYFRKRKKTMDSRLFFFIVLTVKNQSIWYYQRVLRHNIYSSIGRHRYFAHLYTGAIKFSAGVPGGRDGPSSSWSSSHACGTTQDVDVTETRRVGGRVAPGRKRGHTTVAHPLSRKTKYNTYTYLHRTPHDTRR